MSKEITLKELSVFTGIPIKDLEEKPYREVKTLMDAASARKADYEAETSAAKAAEYERLVKKFFTPFIFLSRWFAEDEIVAACARHMGIHDLVSESGGESYMIPGIKYWDPEAELIERNKVVLVKQYDSLGRELVERTKALRDVYRVRSRRQGNYHGKVILDLLYGKFPELMKYGFSAYMYDGCLPYDIYPENHICTPFASLMEGDIEAIVERNEEYAKRYNFGIYTLAKTRERMESEEVQQYFRDIRECAGKL